MKRRVFVDMDGVLCEYDPAAQVADYEREGYFASLAACDRTVDAVRRLIADGESDVYILSAVLPTRKDGSIAEKNGWLDAHLPEVAREHRIFTVCGECKADAVGGVLPSDVLVDDYSHNLRGWVEAGGKGIKVLNGVNGKGGTFVGGPRVRITDEWGLARVIQAI